MKQSIRGIVWSGLVFPGFGQIQLGKKCIGAVFIILTTVGILGLIYCVLLRLPPLIDQLLIEVQQGPVSISRIVELSIQSSRMGNSLLERFVLYYLIGCWVASIIHACHIGKQLDNK